MIGGRDEIIKTASTKEVADQIIRRVWNDDFWPHCVVEDADTAEVLAFSPPATYERLPREFFIYRNMEAKQQWDEEGAIEENSESMIHVLIRDDAVTIVVDHAPTTAMQNLLDALREFDRDLLSVRREAA